MSALPPITDIGRRIQVSILAVRFMSTRPNEKSPAIWPAGARSLPRSFLGCSTAMAFMSREAFELLLDQLLHRPLPASCLTALECSIKARSSRELLVGFAMKIDQSAAYTLPMSRADKQISADFSHFSFICR